MPGPIAVLAAPLLAGILRLVTVGAALRVLILTALTIILPVVPYNVYSEIISHMLTYINSYVGGSGITATVVSLVGLGAWLADCLMVPQAVSILLSCSFVRFVIKMIRG